MPDSKTTNLPKKDENRLHDMDDWGKLILRLKRSLDPCHRGERFGVPVRRRLRGVVGRSGRRQRARSQVDLPRRRGDHRGRAAGGVILLAAGSQACYVRMSQV
jgi:hypothetical protein